MSFKVKTILVNDQNYSNIRIDRWLSVQFPELSRSYIVNLFEKEKITVNGHIVRTSYKMRLNDLIELKIPETESAEIVPLNAPLEIVYEDRELAVINKPSGLVVHPAAGHAQDTLVNILLYHIKDLSMKNENRPGIVHRIDKETSGLLVIAKNDHTHENLSNQFKNKTAHRIYYAVVEGVPTPANGVIQSYLQRSHSDRKKYASVKINNKIIREADLNIENAKWAVTTYKILEKNQGKSLIKLKLQTGRTHQIRIHMSELGCPIVGDVIYGYPQKKYKENDLSRFFLHAAELGFFHPTLNTYMQWAVSWPKKDSDQLKNWGFDV